MCSCHFPACLHSFIRPFLYSFIIPFCFYSLFINLSIIIIINTHFRIHSFIHPSTIYLSVQLCYYPVFLSFINQHHSLADFPFTHSSTQLSIHLSVFPPLTQNLLVVVSSPWEAQIQRWLPGPRWPAGPARRSWGSWHAGTGRAGGSPHSALLRPPTGSGWSSGRERSIFQHSY